jgi:signal transduction histidine kinase
VEALLRPSRILAATVTATRAKALAKPTAHHGGRSFLLYGVPVRSGGAIIVAADLAILLKTVAWTTPAFARLFVTDPSSVVWSGCETDAGCRATPSPAVGKFMRHGGAGPVVSQLGPPAAQELGLPGAPAVLISERMERPTGTWTVTWLASAQDLLARERTLLIRLVLTAMGVALSVGGVGVVMMRQQRKAVALEGRLQYAQAVAGARETSESIVQNAPLGVLGVSQDGRVVLANRFLTDRLGRIRVGAPLREAFSGQGVKWMRELESLLPPQAGPDTDFPLHPEVRAVSTDSQHFHVRIVPVRNAQLGVRTFALVEDRSQLRDLENQLVRAEKLITVGVLSAGIAHEIGSPLAVIRGRAEQVLRHLGSGPRADDLRGIIKHIDHISSTIRQLLDFSRRQPITRRAVSLEAAVERARSLLQWKLEAKQLRLCVSLADGLPMLAADPDQLQQVLVNLLLNACDASDPGQEVVLRALGARDGVVRLEIVDHGCGIAPEHMHAVFDPFFTTKKRGEGTGLGLPIVASIVRNHAGEIDVASTHGAGTVVTVLWPADTSLALPAPAPATPPPPASSEPQSHA